MLGVAWNFGDACNLKVAFKGECGSLLPALLLRVAIIHPIMTPLVRVMLVFLVILIRLNSFIDSTRLRARSE